jgi:hypothetical protein
MSISQILVLTGICGAFVVFAVLLAWGDYQTRNVSHGRAAKPQGATGSGLRMIKGAAGVSDAPAHASQAAVHQVN